jgi:hypothetical protein
MAIPWAILIDYNPYDPTLLIDQDWYFSSSGHFDLLENVMSYRALFTVQSLNAAGEVENQCHAITMLDEDFRRGELLAELIGKERLYPHAAAFIDRDENAAGINYGITYKGVEWAGLEEFRNTMADQEWTISFQLRGDYCRVVISGKDSGGEEIFKRVTVYGF